MKVFDFIACNWELAGILFGILVNAAALAYNVYKFCRNGRVRTLENMQVMLEAAREYEVEAERFEGYTSAEKLNYVLSRLRTLAAELGCAFEEERLIALITEDIDFGNVIGASVQSKERGEGA